MGRHPKRFMFLNEILEISSSDDEEENFVTRVLEKEGRQK